MGTPTNQMLGEMQTVGADGGGEPGVAGDEQQQTPPPAGGQQLSSLGLPRGIGLRTFSIEAQDDGAAAWQGADGLPGIGQPRRVGHQDQARQCAASRAPRFEASRLLC